ncbi:PREDICTED: carbohydrate sulfotransferase 3-like [Cyprinodon variegatus]|uniref:carbohydrate sulfotransferase 3-like n=1 Tax=Cyprinodon variegatus TaxID=28743 RepID=UPI0007424FCF|nr:PREDICTED: carbohydrate sulfotransferase 3-like [Cyprinodon variegatus]
MISSQPANRGNNSSYTNILIMTSTRTGSSFVGNIFNHHGETMFYLFEPLWHVSKSRKANRTLLEELYRNVLWTLFRCDFSLLELFIDPPPKKHVTSSLYHRDSSRALCETPVCTRYCIYSFILYHCNSPHCGPLNLTLASESCLSRKHHVIKTVRLQQLDLLQPLIEDPDLQLKIIQLVRDPRAIVASRMVAFSTYNKWKYWAQHGKVPEDDEGMKGIREYCSHLQFNAKLGLSRPTWLKSHYMLVRYEDITQQPLKKAEEMYNFTGIPFNSQVREWILNNTQKSDNNIYSSQRNSSEQADKWRKKFPFKLAQVVQQVCEPAMKLFGYKLVSNQETLANLSISLTEEKVFN